MANMIFNGVIQLRYDSEENFAKIQNSFIPESGECCLIVTSKGVRVKVGDGSTLLANLEYIDTDLINQINSVVTRGYLLNGKFYTDSTYTVELDHVLTKIYIDGNSNIIYQYDGSKYVSVNDTLPTASDVTAGIMKLYHGKGLALDGTMTQKSITDNLNTKFEVEVNEKEECAVFTITL